MAQLCFPALMTCLCLHLARPRLLMTASRSLTPQTYHSICLLSISPQYIISSTISVTGIPNCDCSSIAHHSSLPLLSRAWLDDLPLISFSCSSTIRVKHLSDILRTDFNTDTSLLLTAHIKRSVPDSLGCDWKYCVLGEAL